jgi:iron complex outermembrane receptor protein
MRIGYGGLIVAFCAGASAADLRVVDGRGAAVAGAEVYIFCGGIRQAKTNAEGAVSLDCGAPAARGRVKAAGFEEADFELSQGQVRLLPAIIHTRIEVEVNDRTDEPTVSGSALEIEKTGARTVLDAVEKLAPGAFVTRRGVLGYGIATNGTGGITVRGIGGQPNTGVLMVIDGRPDIQGLMGHPLPDMYSLSDAARVTVTQGPASVLYGSNAMGGAVEITPFRPSVGTRTSLTTSLGSYWTTQNRLSHGSQKERWFYQATAGWSQTSGDRPGSDFRERDATLAIGRDFNPHWRASLQGRFGWFHVEDPGTIYTPLRNAYARVGRGGYNAGLDNAYSRTHGSVRAFGAHGKHYITDGFRSTDSSNGVRAIQTLLAAPALQFDFGGDLWTYGGQARNVTRKIEYGDHSITDGGGFTRTRWNLTTALRLLGGLRVHGNSRYGSLVAPEAGAQWRITEKAALSGVASRGFRNPTIGELHLFPAPNPGLSPERMWNYQATIDLRPARSLAFWATAYYADLLDQIVPLGRFPNLQLRNTGRSLNRGVDVSGRWQLVRTLCLQGGYGYLRSTNIAPLAPGHKFNGSLDWVVRRIALNFGAMAVGPRYPDMMRQAQMGGYTLLTAKATIPIGERCSAFVFADNLTDKRYEVLPGYVMPGTNVSAGLQWQF